jgi:hypothetical protein
VKLGVAKKDYLKEMNDGVEKWLRLCAYACVVWLFLDLLPRLPAELGKRIVEGIFKKIGI